MRRLYSTFAGGWPGMGLVLMRLVVGFALIMHASSTLRSGAPAVATISAAVLAVLGILLISGLWTPIAGMLVVLLELWKILTLPGDPWVLGLLATISGALALLGPGLWSIDARLFGWKRVAPPPRQSSRTSR